MCVHTCHKKIPYENNTEPEELLFNTNLYIFSARLYFCRHSTANSAYFSRTHACPEYIIHLYNCVIWISISYIMPHILIHQMSEYGLLYNT